MRSGNTLRPKGRAAKIAKYNDEVITLAYTRPAFPGQPGNRLNLRMRRAMTRNDSDVPRGEPVTVATDRGQDESSSAAAEDRDDEGRFVVSGRVTWADGSPVAQ